MNKGLIIIFLKNRTDLENVNIKTVKKSLFIDVLDVQLKKMKAYLFVFFVLNLIMIIFSNKKGKKEKKFKILRKTRQI